mgnify:CR=1 FL=1
MKNYRFIILTFGLLASGVVLAKSDAGSAHYVSPEKIAQMVQELNHMTVKDLAHKTTVNSFLKRYEFDCASKPKILKAAYATCMSFEDNPNNPGGWPAQVLGLERGKIVAAIATQKNLQITQQKQWSCHISKSSEQLNICVLKSLSKQQKRYWHRQWTPFFSKDVG